MPRRFLELAIAAPDVLESYQYYTRLGFTPATTGDAWRHRYAVLTDGRLPLALHGLDLSSPSLRYVQPGLKGELDAMARAGIEAESIELGEDRFNAASFRDPDGLSVMLVEARTFSAAEVAQPSLLGWFEELALPVRDPAAALAFWESFGFVAVGEEADPWPHVALTSDHINLGLYRGTPLEAPTLRFSVEDLAATGAALTAVGIAPRARPAPGLKSALAFSAPEGTAILITPRGG